MCKRVVGEDGTSHRVLQKANVLKVNSPQQSSPQTTVCLYFASQTHRKFSSHRALSKSNKYPLWKGGNLCLDPGKVLTVTNVTPEITCRHRTFTSIQRGTFPSPPQLFSKGFKTTWIVCKLVRLSRSVIANNDFR